MKGDLMRWLWHLMQWFFWPLAVLSLAALISGAEAGTITISVGGTAETITTTAGHDALFELLRQHMNTQRLGGGPFPYPTPSRALREIFEQGLRQQLQETRQVDTGNGCERYRTLTPAQQSTIDNNFGTSLGLGRPVSPCP
jgi:hypothetical protein